MSDMLTVKQVAELWNVPETQVSRYCRESRIEGTRKEGGIWLIPSTSQNILIAEKVARRNSNLPKLTVKQGHLYAGLTCPIEIAVMM